MKNLTAEQATRLREAQEREQADSDANVRLMDECATQLVVESLHRMLAPRLECGRCGGSNIHFVGNDAVCRGCGHRQTVA
jgi:hypothetical protein